MEEKRLEEYRQQLLNQKKELSGRIDGLNQGLLDPMRESIGELSLYDNHPADIGDELFERSKDLSLRDQANLQMTRVDRALEKIAAGSYGICDRCGGSISDQRLEAMPEANLCIDCKEREEVPDATPRPIEEQVIHPPFGEHWGGGWDRKFGDGDNDPKFDGEDSWQEVARYGSSDTPQDLADSGAQYPDVYDDWDEERGAVADVDAIQYVRGKDGMAYEK